MQTKVLKALKGGVVAAVMGTLAACGPVGFNGADFKVNVDQNGTVSVSVEGSLGERKTDPDSSDGKDVPNADSDLSKVKRILDLIGRTEGTDKGDGYDETLAYGAFTNGDVVLTDMTLAEIDVLQTDMLRHPKNHWGSSAIGRYQIVRTTLRKLKKKLELEDGVEFTAELQDKLAFELLKDCGFIAWKAGDSDDRQFALNLAKVWASLPNPVTGKGYYSGQSAAVDYATLKDVLKLSR